MQTIEPQPVSREWTLGDDNKAWLEGWWIGDEGIVGKIEYVIARAKEGSDLHIRALQLVALCRLTNTSPILPAMKWTPIDQDAAHQEGWWIRDKELNYNPVFFKHESILRDYLLGCAKQNSLLHIKALRNLR